MPVPIFDQSVIEEKKQEKKPEKEKVSGWVIFFSIILVSAMVVISEFALRDVNRIFNPSYADCATYSEINLSYPYVIQKAPIDPEICSMEKYERSRLILHADLAVPLILLSILAYLFVRGRKFKGAAKVLFISYFIFICWIIIRVVSETEYFFLKHYSLYGKYLILISLVIVITALIVLVQKKIRRKTPGATIGKII